MVQKIFLYSSVVIAAVIIPILGVLTTVIYTLLAIAQVIFKSIANVQRRQEKTELIVPARPTVR